DDGRTLDAKVIGKDSKTDLALLKIKDEGTYPYVQFGKAAPRVGDWVVAIGNPFGLGGSVTAGIISARARDIGQGNYDDFLQTDASINMGNSGGPLINMAGEVVGINTAIFSRTGGSIGFGFAIPATLAKNVVAQLREGGKVRRGWLGVQISAVDQAIAESMGLKEAKGALVGVVSDNGPAKAAGIKPGDVILSFDGKEVTNNRALPRIVAETPVGKKVAVNLFRKGERLTVPVTLGELKEDAQVAAAPQGESNPGPDPQTIEPVGVAVAPLLPQVRQQFQLDEDTSGVVVTKVTPNSPAAQRGLRAGDVIVEVSQEEVASPADVSTRVQKAKEAGQKALLLLIERGGELLFVALPLAEG
ncbi:MAG TPA: PDZ domain-containing protein, partial [Azospirillaceae bacterium]|nr:PDZ domain-containing protein [Azospirillaceae bacterium]